MRPFLVASFNDIYRSYPFSLPTLAVPALSAVTMEYSSNVAGEQIDITLTVAATNVVTAKGEKLTLVTEPAFTFTDSSVCFYTDANEDSNVLSIVRGEKSFSLVLDSDMKLDTPITCTGATALAHGEATATATYEYEHGPVFVDYTLPAVYDIPPFTTTFSTDSTVPGALATHTFTFVTEQTYDIPLTLFVNVSSIVSSEPQSCTCDKAEKITFEQAMVGLKFPANSFEKLVEVSLVCVIHNRATAVPEPPTLHADLYDSEMNHKLTSVFDTTGFFWPMDKLTVQTISFETEHSLKSDDVARIFSVYESVYYISHSAIKIVRVTYDDDLYSRVSSDTEYDITIHFKSLSIEAINSKRDQLRTKLAHYFDDVEVGAAGEYEYPAHCSDGKKNADESDLDCGGSCVGCDNFEFCHDNDDCLYHHCKKPFYVCENSAFTVGAASVAMMIIAAVFAL
jgi:hypothetical protein